MVAQEKKEKRNKKEGKTWKKMVDASGRTIHRVVPLGTYTEARERALFDTCERYVYTFGFGHGSTAFSFSGRL